MKKGPEKIQVSSAGNGFIPQQQIENKYPQSWCREGPEGRCFTSWVVRMGRVDIKRADYMWVSGCSWLSVLFFLKLVDFFPFWKKYCLRSFMKYDNHILLEGKMEFKNGIFFRDGCIRITKYHSN